MVTCEIFTHILHVVNRRVQPDAQFILVVFYLFPANELFFQLSSVLRQFL